MSVHLQTSRTANRASVCRHRGPVTKTISAVTCRECLSHEEGRVMDMLRRQKMNPRLVIQYRIRQDVIVSQLMAITKPLVRNP